MKPIDLFRAGFWGSDNTASIIAGLFAQGQQGFWLPFTDFDSLTQDSAGTLPYTALEQPVGKVLDRSGRGNHATQPTSTARGAVSARVNLLQSTQAFAGGQWVKTGLGIASAPVVTDDYSLAPDGTMTAARVQMTVNGGSAVGDISKLWQSSPVAAGVSYSQSIYIKSLIGPTTLGFRDDVSIVVQKSISINDTWQRFDGSGVASASASVFGLWLRTAVGTSGFADFLVWRPSMTLTSNAALPFQSVNTTTDYDAVGFPKYLRLDGTDDSYTCGGGGSTTGFFYSDVITLIASATPTLMSNILPNKGYLAILMPTNKVKLFAGDGVAFSLLESIDALAIGVPSCVQMWDDGVNLSIQINNGAIASVARPAVQAGPSAVSLYYGGGGAYFNGKATEPIYRAGPPPSAYEREVIRNYQMQKAGML